MSNERRICPLCNTPVTVLDGMREVTCAKCGNIIRIDGDKAKTGRRFKLLPQAVILVLLIAALVGIWVYIGTRDSGGAQSSTSYTSQAGDAWINAIGGEPRASDVNKRDFHLYEYHVDDTVRIVKTVYISGSGSTRTTIWSPLFRVGDEMLTVDFINARFVEQYSYEQEYNGRLDTGYQYTIDTMADHYGYDMLTNRGYLHVRETDRLLSIGSDPQTYNAQDIVAVAIPISAQITSIYDYQPYRHITLGAWDIFYYDVTNISSHVSIHIVYIPGEDAPKLDWAAVEAAR